MRPASSDEMKEPNFDEELIREVKVNSIRLGGKTKLLGSTEEHNALDNGGIEDGANANEKIEELIQKGYIPTFPMDRLEALDSLMEKGMNPREPLMEGHKTLSGTIGRLHNPHKNRYLVAVIDPSKEGIKFSPRFTEKGKFFVGGLTPDKIISSDNLVILDPETLEIVWAPPGVADRPEKVIIVNRETKSLGNHDVSKELRQGEYNSGPAARKAIEQLLSERYLPVFPFKKEQFENVRKEGLAPSRSNVKDVRGWRGSIGREPIPTDYYAVITDRNLAGESIEPFFSEDNLFSGIIYMDKKIPAEAIAIIDAKTGEVISAPEGVESEPVIQLRKGFSRSVKENLPA